ncbi:MAG: hypothetical protein SH847_15030 [Roseiflexaceae bacterium]|nr:hypothetical protein [Roseiflexaceae bacterium]
MAMDITHLEAQELEQLRDAINRRLLQMRRTKGLTLPELLHLFEEVKQTLTDQGKEWRSLERWQWMEGEIRFWLNPNDQANYQSGWFSIDDLIAWAHNSGPVVIEEEFEEEEEFNTTSSVNITRLSDEAIRRDEPQPQLS